MMEIAALGFVLLILAGIAILHRLTSRTQSTSYSNLWPLEQKPPLNAGELLLYWKLTAAFPNAIVLAQVQVQQFVKQKAGQRDRALQNRFDRLSVDYLIVTRQDASIIAAVELDGPKHNRQDRKKTDAKKDHVLASAKVRLVRYRVQDNPTIEEIRAALQPAAQATT